MERDISPSLFVNQLKGGEYHESVCNRGNVPRRAS